MSCEPDPHRRVRAWYRSRARTPPRPCPSASSAPATRPPRGRSCLSSDRRAVGLADRRAATWSPSKRTNPLFWIPASGRGYFTKYGDTGQTRFSHLQNHPGTQPSKPFGSQRVQGRPPLPPLPPGRSCSPGHPVGNDGPPVSWRQKRWVGFQVERSILLYTL